MMHLLSLILLFVRVGGQGSGNLPNFSLIRDPNTKLVIFGTRHGNRNPGVFLDSQPQRQWGLEGANELNQFGKREAYGLGITLREFLDGFLEQNYMADAAKFATSSASRCQMTLQVAQAGLYPPRTFADWNAALKWSPVPYAIDDPMLRIYAVADCLQSDQVYQPIVDDNLPELAALTRDQQPLLQYIANHTGWNASISSASDLADNLLEIELYNTSLPDWIANPTLPGYSQQQLTNAIRNFTDNHAIACANYEPCRDVMGGIWLNDILMALRKAANQSEKTTPKLVGYASVNPQLLQHADIALSLMKLLGIEKNSLTTSAGFIIEYRDLPFPSVRLLNHDPNPIDDHVIYQANYQSRLAAIADTTQWVRLAAFIDLVAGKEIADWQSACGRAATNNARQRNLSGVLLIAVGTIMLSLTKYVT